MGRYPEPRAGRFTPPGEQRESTGLYEALPHAAGFPPSRGEAPRVPAAEPTYDQHGGYESFNVSVPAPGSLVEVCRFSGIPDSVILSTSGPDLEVRFRRRGGPPGDFILIAGAPRGDVVCTGEIVEARDPAAAGGIQLRVLARYSRRDGAPVRPLIAPAGDSSA